MGITVAREDIMSSFKLGEHSTTFSGNSLTCAVATATIDIIREEKLPERTAELGSILMKKLSDLEDECKIIREVRGMGLMIGIESRFDVLNIILKVLDREVLIGDAGRNIIRLLPPLVISQDQLDRVFEVLSITVREEENERLRARSSS